MHLGFAAAKLTRMAAVVSLRPALEGCLATGVVADSSMRTECLADLEGRGSQQSPCGSKGTPDAAGQDKVSCLARMGAYVREKKRYAPTP